MRDESQPIMSEAFVGIVKWFNHEKGYGFVRADTGERDVFLHITTLQACNIKHIENGQQISFEVTIDPRRQRSLVTTITLIPPILPKVVTTPPKSKPLPAARSLRRVWLQGIEETPLFDHWHASFRQRIMNSSSQADFIKETRLATMELLARAARSMGWSVQHTSSHESRVSSRYIVIPKVGICRISNHKLGPTHKVYWNGEIVIQEQWRTMPLNEWLMLIQQEAQRPKIAANREHTSMTTETTEELALALWAKLDTEIDPLGIIDHVQTVPIIRQWLMEKSIVIAQAVQRDKLQCEKAATNGQ